ncbi:MAG: RICIN domain-containing protein [Gallionellaceae bacterium]|nr:RICIN domain-containing protein [Gallionellaceae bacterium]
MKIQIALLCCASGFAVSVGADSLSVQYRDGTRQTLPLNQSVANIRALEMQAEGGPANQYGQDLSGVHTLRVRHSGQCLDVSGVSLGSGANVYQWDCHGGDNQKWRFQARAGGYYQIAAVHSGKCLDVAGAGTGNGANVQQWDCHGGDNQLWQAVGVGGGVYRLRAKHSGRCLDVAGVGKGNGVNVHQWDCHDGDNQKWSIE